MIKVKVQIKKFLIFIKSRGIPEISEIPIPKVPIPIPKFSEIPIPRNPDPNICNN
jgi:hypothetical protein